MQYRFTTTQTVPAGGQVVGASWGDTYEPTRITTYGPDRVTAIETNLVVTQSAGTDALTSINHHHRVIYGSNNYEESAIRQFLNSDAETFKWLPKTPYDRPSSYGGGGFLSRIDPELVAVIGSVTKQVARNIINDGGGQDTFDDKVFLLSRVEIYGGSEGTTTGEKVYPYYETMAPSATSGELAERIKLLNGSPRSWWLRSPHAGGTYSVRTVYTDGIVSTNSAYYSRGLAPACCIW